MKKATSISCCLLFGQSTLLLTGKLICNCIGYTFRLTNVSVFAVIICLLSVCTSVFSLISGKTESKLIRVLLILTIPLSLVNIFLYLIECTSTLVYVCMVITAVHNLFLAVWHENHLSLKISEFLLTAIISLNIYCLGFLCLIFGNFGQTTVVRTVEAPNATYRAEVLDINQGALGGDTVVDVYENGKHFNLYILTISKKPQRVYIGNWGEFKNMRIQWKDEHCLVINSVEYEIE